MRLDGKTIIVTGSGTGIGKAIAKLCIDEGAHVVISDKDEKLANDVNILGTLNVIKACKKNLFLAEDKIFKLDRNSSVTCENLIII